MRARSLRPVCGKPHNLRTLRLVRAPPRKEPSYEPSAGILAVLTLGALVLADTAGATKPFMERDVQGPFTLGETCSVPVLIQPTAPDVMNFFIFSDRRDIRVRAIRRDRHQSRHWKDGQDQSFGQLLGGATQRRHGHYHLPWLRPLKPVRHHHPRPHRHPTRRQWRCDLEHDQRDGGRPLRRVRRPVRNSSGSKSERERESYLAAAI